MANDNLYTFIQQVFKYKPTKLEIERLKTAIQQDEQDERAAQQAAFYNSLPDNCVTGNRNACIEPIKTCKLCME